MQSRSIGPPLPFSIFRTHNILCSDPVQLNLLYEQSRKAIKIGAHPVEMKIARQLAAFMLQMVYGDHNDAKHIPAKIE